jgi:hypothetical protein
VQYDAVQFATDLIVQIEGFMVSNSGFTFPSFPFLAVDCMAGKVKFSTETEGKVVKSIAGKLGKAAIDT